MQEKIVFVYNAKSGAANAALDAAQKILKPASYPCDLCKITHGLLGEKRKWKKFRKASSVPMEFLHSDEFEKQYASKFTHKFKFPVVLVEGANGFEILVSRQELAQIPSAEKLIGLLKKRII